MKKLFVSLLCVVMLVTFMPSMAFASDDSLNKTTVSTYEEFKNALEAGGNVELAASFSTDEAVEINITKPVTLNLNGYTVTSNAAEINHFIMEIKNGGALILEDTAGTGKLEATDSSYGYGIQLFSNASFVMNGGTIETTQETVDIYDSSSNTNVEINGGKVISTKDNVLGIRGRSNVNVQIKGGELTADGRVAFYVSSYEENAINLDISGGTITNKDGSALQIYSGANVTVTGNAVIISEDRTGIQLQAGESLSTLKIEGGTISGGGYSGYGVTVQDNANFVMTGGEVKSESSNGIMVYDQSEIHISGGKVTGASRRDAVKKSDESTAEVTITDGTFSSDVTKFVPAGFTGAYDPETGKLTTAVDENPAEGNEIALAQDFNLWGEQYKGWYNVGWKYGDNFNTDLITKIVVGITDEEGKGIVTYTADEQQLAYQRANGYMNNKQSSAPFGKSIFGGKDDEFRDSDWTAVKGEAFEEFAAAKAFVEIYIGNNVKRLDYECTHKHIWGEWKTVTEATTTQTGLKERVCTDENCVAKQSEVIEKLPAPVDPPYIPPTNPVQKPVIEAEEGAVVTLSKDGTTAAIVVDENATLKDVLLNGKSLGAVTEVKNLKTGDKLVVVVETLEEKNARLKAGVENTSIRMYYKKGEIGKGWIKLRFKKEFGFKVDNYEIFRSPKKKTNFGEKAWFVTKTNKTAGYYKNGKSVKKGTRYYYKMRGVREIAGETVYTQWSNIVMRTGR